MAKLDNIIEKKVSVQSLGPHTPDAAWAVFVSESGSKGRNNSMLGLFLRLYGCGMDIDEAIAYAGNNFREEWPSDIDDDLEEQLSRAASRAWESRNQDYHVCPGKNVGASQKSVQERRKAEVARLKEENPTSRTLEVAAGYPADKRFVLRKPEIIHDDQCFGEASFMADVLRALAGENAYVFLGHREDSAFNRPCWFFTDQVPGHDTLNPAVGDDLKNTLSERLREAAGCNDWPELICNCSFLKPERHIDSTGKAVGHRRKDYVSRITCFTVECDKMLSSGIEPQTEEEKAKAKAETLELFQRLHVEAGLTPVLIVDSGNKSLQATYLLQLSAKPLDEQVEQMHRLGDFIGVLGGDPAVLSVPRVFRAPEMQRVTRDENGGIVRSAKQGCLHFDSQAPRYDLADVIMKVRGMLGARPSFVDELDAGTELNLDTLRRYMAEQQMCLRFNLMSHQIELNDWQRFKLCSHDVTIEDLPVLLYDQLKPLLKCRKEDFAPMIATIAHENYYHPVVDWMRGLPEDTGRDAIEELCACIGVEKDTLGYLLIEKWLKQCVAMAFNSVPGQDPVQPYGVLVLQGPQGMGKTTLLKRLAVKNSWFTSVLNLDPDNKDSVIQATARWICEIGELDATTRKEQANLKALLTSSVDTVRRPYDHTATSYPRTTSFAASVNPEKFLTDQSGNRRFWTIRIGAIDRERLNGLRVERLWAQAYHAWMENPDFDLSEEELAKLEGEVNAKALQSLPGEEELRSYIHSFDSPKYVWLGASQILSIPELRSLKPQRLCAALKKIYHEEGHDDYIRVEHHSNLYWIPKPNDYEWSWKGRDTPRPASFLENTAS